MRELTDTQAKRIAADRGRHFESVAESAAAAAYEAVRMLRKELRGEERERWEMLAYPRQRKWVERARLVGLGRVRGERGLYGLVMNLEDGEALELAWQAIMDWRLLELGVEFATLRLVMGSVVPEAVGPVLPELRRSSCA